jgi:hypothetical protein
MVLDSVETLLKNVDAETVAISADHGEAFGELGVNRHPIAIPHPKIKRVPWALTSATDKGKYEPMTYDQRGQGKGVTEHLEDLGYL